MAHELGMPWTNTNHIFPVRAHPYSQKLIPPILDGLLGPTSCSTAEKLNLQWLPCRIWWRYFHNSSVKPLQDFPLHINILCLYYIFPYNDLQITSCAYIAVPFHKTCTSCTSSSCILLIGCCPMSPSIGYRYISFKPVSTFLPSVASSHKTVLAL